MSGCFRCQRYKFLKAIHNIAKLKGELANVVSDVKDTNFWKQFTTVTAFFSGLWELFPMSKIQIFESNSQQFCYCCVHNLVVSDVKDTNFWKQFTTNKWSECKRKSCFRCQRYKFLKAIHNHFAVSVSIWTVVSDVKDTNFWKQFTTKMRTLKSFYGCFRCQRYKFLKAIHNHLLAQRLSAVVVSDVKDTNFWKQFTTCRAPEKISAKLFPMSKIQIFESNSQLATIVCRSCSGCFRCQRYKFLKAIHNYTAINPS